MRRRFLLATTATLAAIAMTGPVTRAGHGDQLPKLREKYEKEQNPVRKAKDLARFGEAQVADAAQRTNARDFQGALHELNDYASEIASTHKALLDANGKPTGNMAGLHELQISLRENLRRIHDMIQTMPVGEQEQFQSVQESLDQQNERMLAEIFPMPAAAAPARNTEKP